MEGAEDGGGSECLDTGDLGSEGEPCGITLTWEPIEHFWQGSHTPWLGFLKYCSGHYLENRVNRSGSK